MKDHCLSPRFNRDSQKKASMRKGRGGPSITRKIGNRRKSMPVAQADSQLPAAYFSSGSQGDSAQKR